MHFAGVNVFGEWFAPRDPGGCECIAEGLHLRNKPSVGNLEWSSITDLAEFGGIELLIVTVGNAFSEILITVIPRPLMTTELLLVVKSWLWTPGSR